MNRKPLLLGRIFLLLFLMLGMILTGCNLGKKSEGEGSGDFEASGTLDAETQEQLNTAKRIFYSLPSPLETAMLIKNAGAAYNEELMNPVSNLKKQGSESGNLFYRFELRQSVRPKPGHTGLYRSG